MSAVSTWLLRSGLRGAFTASVANSIPLYDQLLANEAAAVNTLTAVASGIKRMAANGHDVEVFSGTESQLGAKLTGEAWSRLVDLHDEVKAYLGGSPTDEVIKTEMLGILVPVTEVASCFAAALL